MLVKARWILFCLVAAAAVTAAVPVGHYEHEGPQIPAQYEYSYSVQDEVNGDVKEQKENRDGNTVRGFYSFIQPDGTRRIVEYTADKEHGFNAVVRYEGHSGKGLNKAALAAPANVRLSYDRAPVAKEPHAAPVHKLPKIAYAQAPRPFADAAPAYTAPISYSRPAPFSYNGLPAYPHYPITRVTYTSPLFSYHHF